MKPWSQIIYNEIIGFELAYHNASLNFKIPDPKYYPKKYH